MKTEKCAALTMVWKSYTMLEKWIKYYGDAFGHEHLYVLAHGNDPIIEELCKDVNLWVLPRAFSVDFDPVRWDALSKMTSSLTKFYAGVVCGDCDELVVLERNNPMGLEEYILSQKGEWALRPVGFNLVPNFNGKRIKSINWHAPITSQIDQISGSVEYSKPCIVFCDVEFGTGGHTLAKGAQKIDTNLALFHLKYIDIEQWRGAADQLYGEIRKESKAGKNEKQIGTLWREGFKSASGMSATLAKGKFIDVDDYHLWFANYLAGVNYDAQTRREQRKYPTRGALPARFMGGF